LNHKIHNLVGKEDLLPAVAPLGDVMRDVGDDDARESRAIQRFRAASPENQFTICTHTQD
jgi:hypothetical protein